MDLTEKLTLMRRFADMFEDANVSLVDEDADGVFLGEEGATELCLEVFVEDGSGADFVATTYLLSEVQEFFRLVDLGELLADEESFFAFIP